MSYGLYDAAVQIANLDFMKWVLIVLVIVIAVLSYFSFLGKLISPSPNSHKARKLMTDLYVIGMIRKFAKEDGVELETEMKNLRQIEKWERMSRKDFDNQIEEELKEKIVAKTQKEIDKINAEKK